MGGGGLRILGHKKWHVWKRENIERVRRDEREHAEKLASDRQNKRKRDQEYRIEQLKKKNSSESSSNHINLFQQEEEQKLNEEHEKERKETELKEQKRLGIAPMALGGKLNKAEGGSKPWYTYTKQENIPQKNQIGKVRSKEEQQLYNNRQERLKEKFDPLVSMKEYLVQHRDYEETYETNKRGIYEGLKTTPGSVLSECSKTPLQSGEKRSTRDSHKKSKKKKKSKHSEAKLGKKKNTDIELLRQARLLREKQESRKAQKLLHGTASPWMMK